VKFEVLMVVTTNTVFILEVDSIHLGTFLRDAGTYLPNYVASHPVSHNDSIIEVTTCCMEPHTWWALVNPVMNLLAM
jgi:hypothetical protein